MYPRDVINRDYVCNYSMLASHFVNNVQFTKNVSKGMIFVQSSNESEFVARLMFKNLKSKPDFEIFRIIEDPRRTIQDRTIFPFVTEVSVKRWDILSSMGSSLFPKICKSTYNCLK